MMLVPAPAGVKVVCATPAVVPLVRGETELLPDETVNVFVMSSGTKVPPLVVSVPAEFLVRFVRITEV